MLLESQKICLLKRDCCCGHSRQLRVMLEFVVKISLPAGEMGDYLMPSFINTGNCTFIWILLRTCVGIFFKKKQIQIYHYNMRLVMISYWRP